MFDVPFTDRCLTIKQTAAHLTVSHMTVYKLIREGRLTPTKIGTRTLIRGREIQRFLDEADAA